MNIKIYKDDNLRIYSDYEKHNFIDIISVGYESMAINLYGSFSYIEIREKESRIRVFSFQKKAYKKECDFGWWEDAEVVYSLNKRI